MAGLLSVVGCGVSTEGDATTIADLALPTDATTSSTTPAARPVDLYLVRDTRLVVVRREIDPHPADVLAALLAGPSGDELDDGLRSAVPEDAHVLGVTSSSGVVTVDLDEEFTSVSGREHLLALAQIVYSLNALEGVDGVRFSVEGVPVEVPRSDGTLTGRPLRPSDYPELGPG